MFKRDYRLKDRSLLNAEDTVLAGEVIEPVWRLPYPSDDSVDRPRHWKRATDGQLLVYSMTWLARTWRNGRKRPFEVEA